MFMMDLRLASINGRGLRSDSRRSHLFLYLQRRGIDICCLQETRFDFNFHEDILSKDYLSFSACFDGRSRGVTWLISRTSGRHVCSCSFRSGGQTLRGGRYHKG